MRVDRDRIGALEVRHAVPVARRTGGPPRHRRHRRAATGPRQRRRRRARRRHRRCPVFVDPATAAMANGVRPAARSRATAAATDARADGRRRRPGARRGCRSGTPVRRGPARSRSGSGRWRRRGRPRGRGRAAARPVPRSLPRCRSRARVMAMKLAITPPLVSRPNGRLVVAHEVAQPAHDLLLDERRERAGVPDVDALVGDLGEQLAHDRHRQRRRREVAELARVLAVHESAGQPGAELRDDLAAGVGSAGRAAGPAADGRSSARRTSAYGDGSPIARCTAGRTGSRGRPAQVWAPGRSGRVARRALVAVADQLRLGVPGEAGEVRVEVGRRGRMWVVGRSVIGRS